MTLAGSSAGRRRRRDRVGIIAALPEIVLLRIAQILSLGSLTLGTVMATGCSGSDSVEIPDETGEDDLVHRARAHWIYDGPLPALADANVTVSLRGHTARLTGYSAGDVDISQLPHARKSKAGKRTRIDLVYPIATGEKASYNSEPGRHPFVGARPYYPDADVVNEFGTNFVLWGGFPFLNYDGGSALHGPISVGGSSGREVFYHRRGHVSH